MPSNIKLRFNISDRLRWSRRFGFAALIAFALCLALNLAARMTPPSAGDQTCTKEILPASVSKEPASADREGVLRIVYVRDREYWIGQPVCVVVAGVSLAEKQLSDDAESKNRTLKTATADAAAAKVKLDEAEKALEAAQKAKTDPPSSDVQDALASVAAAKDALKAATDSESQAQADFQTARDKLADGPPTVELTPFLNNFRADSAKTKVPATEQLLAVPFDFGSSADASGPVAAFWRNVLSGGTDNWSGKKTFALGLTRKDSGISELQSPPLISFRIYDWLTLMVGAATIVFTAASIALLASCTTLLRDNNQLIAQSDIDQAEQNYKNLLADTKAKFKTDDEKKELDKKVRDVKRRYEYLRDNKDGPIGTWSLGRTQMALWMLIVLAGFLFFWIGLGEYQNVINGSILTLLGLNSATGLLAISVAGSKNATAASRSFLLDILNDGSGPQLQRVQVVIWTIVLAVVFLWSVFYNFTFVQFDTYLLLLIGIAQATYIGFKPGEAAKAPQASDIAPDSAVAGDLTPYTIEGSNLTGVDKVEFLDANGKITPAEGLSKTENEITFTLTLAESGEYTVQFTSGGAEPTKIPGKVTIKPKGDRKDDGGATGSGDEPGAGKTGGSEGPKTGG